MAGVTSMEKKFVPTVGYVSKQVKAWAVVIVKTLALTSLVQFAARMAPPMTMNVSSKWRDVGVGLP